MTLIYVCWIRISWSRIAIGREKEAGKKSERESSILFRLFWFFFLSVVCEYSGKVVIMAFRFRWMPTNFISFLFSSVLYIVIVCILLSPYTHIASALPYIAQIDFIYLYVLVFISLTSPFPTMLLVLFPVCIFIFFISFLHCSASILNYNKINNSILLSSVSIYCKCNRSS